MGALTSIIYHETIDLPTMTFCIQFKRADLVTNRMVAQLEHYLFANMLYNFVQTISNGVNRTLLVRMWTGAGLLFILHEVRVVAHEQLQTNVNLRRKY